MSATTPSKSSRPRIKTIQSFPASGDPISPSRIRSNTVHTPSINVVPDARQLILSPEEHGKKKSSDIFDSDGPHQALEEQSTEQVPNLQTLDQLPIEIRSFTERFLKSLSSKSHATPLDIDAISDLFQDFYIQAESHIATHIAALTTKLSRNNSPAPSVTSRRTVSAKASQDSFADQQMLTASEIADKRKARRLLQTQHALLDEAVERGVCEKVYSKIYRHRSTDDEEKDAKLRSKTAALSLVGVGLKELHVDVPVKTGEDATQVQKDIYDRLATARASLQRMDKEHFPLGKLQHLTAAHQSIVETLAHVFPSTSSADEVLPTLIYTLVTSPAESLNVASNLHFIQRFRANARIDGEAAYCLVNLEAAISFLETVDLSSLAADQPSTGIPLKSDSTALEASDEQNPDRLKSLTDDLPAVSNPKQRAIKESEAGAPPSPTRPRPLETQQRRISYMIQAQAERIEAGRENFLSSADQAFDSINSTLESSFKFVFGRLREQEAENQKSPVLIPRTLDDARRLVKSPIQEEDEEALSRSRLSLNAVMAHDTPSKAPLTITARPPARDVSADSTRSGNSNKRASLFGGDERTAGGPAEAVGNFVTSLNPLSRFSVGVPGFGKFGKAVGGTATEQDVTVERSPVTPGLPASNAAEALARLRKAKPPNERYLRVQSSRELRVGEIEDLLVDYKRLAGLLHETASHATL